MRYIMCVYIISVDSSTNIACIHFKDVEYGNNTERYTLYTIYVLYVHVSRYHNIVLVYRRRTGTKTKLYLCTKWILRISVSIAAMHINSISEINNIYANMYIHQIQVQSPFALILYTKYTMLYGKRAAVRGIHKDILGVRHDFVYACCLQNQKCCRNLRKKYICRRTDNSDFIVY